MATGDLKNNLRKLVSELKQVRYSHCELDLKGIAQGIPKTFLPLLHHVFLDYSIPLAQYFSSKEYDLFGKTDLRFLETVYKILRDEFGYKPQVTKEQFLSIGYAERKIMTVCTILKLLKEKHNNLQPKNSRTENKTGRSLRSSRGEDGDKENFIEKDCRRKHHDFPGPLPVGTDMRSFRSNKHALETGLGLKGTLVTRMVTDNDSNFEVRKRLVVSEVIDPFANRGDNNEQLRSSKCEANDGLAQNSEGIASKEHFGVTFPVSANAERRSHLFPRKQESGVRGQSHVKSVTWKESTKDSRSLEIEERAEMQDRFLRSSEPTGSTVISVPTGVGAASLSSNYPVDMEAKKVTTAIPCPVSMTTVPLPSPDLMLTPLVKGIQCKAIPLSSCEKESEFYRTPVPIPLSDLPRTQVVRHSNSFDSVGSEFVALPNIRVESSAELFILRQLVDDLQEKLDSTVLSNNELSARVVLLESRMKLLEDACQKKCSCDKKDLLPAQREEKASRQTDDVIVSGFNVHANKDADKKTTSTSSTGCVAKSFTKQNAANRELFLRTVSTTDKEGHEGYELTSNSDKSDEESCNNNPTKTLQSTEEAKAISSLDKDDSIIISPLPSVSKLTGVFKDSSSSVLSTVVNVQKRLQETRKMLVSSNRDFAEKFSHYQDE